ncbi:MAG: hypothetical protein CMH46_00755 [Muricauda sp.]|nr:hypothetical protein [Allomuricauda sp.]
MGHFTRLIQQGRSHLLNLLTITIKDTYLCPQDFVWDEDGFNEIEAIFETGNKGTHRSFLILMLRSKVLRNDSKSYFSIEAKVLNKTDDSIYESILLSAFNLDFKTLRNKLDAWNPNSSWVMKKAGLLALFDNREAIGYLSKNMENPGYSSQEELYMLEMLSYLKQSVEHRYDRVLSEAISGYKNMGLDSVSENIDNLIDDANKGSGKIERYGEGRFRISNGFSFSNDFTKPQKGLQFLQQMIETGFPISVININWKNPTKCYPLFRTIFEYFPFPTAFYALQFSNEKFLRRLGQDFAYSDNLKLNLDKILATVLNSYLEDSTPNGIKQNILYFASELFIAVDPKTWQDNFLKIWNIASFKERCLDDRWFAERTFTISCIKFIQNPKILTEFLHTLLINPISDYSVYLTFYLAKNPIIKKLGETLQSNEVAQAVDTLINSMHQNESAVFMTGNLYDILTDSQKANIRKNIQKLDFEKIENLRLWRVLIYFSTDDNDTRYKIKTAIIKNKKLFNAGFTKNSLRMGADFIEISKFTNTKAPEYISWSTTEAKEIFKRLLSELKKIDGYSGKSGHDFISILSEMQTFLNREQSKIKDVKEYNMAREKVDSLYIQSRGYESLSDGIISTENTDVVWALSELSSLMYQKNSIQGLELEISSLLNKVLLQSEPSLEACLNYFASWLNDEQLSNGFKKYDEIILKILKRYSDNELQEFDKPFVYEQLVGIANTLSNWGMIDDSIEHWKTIEKQTSYNNIRFKEEAK